MLNLTNQEAGPASHRVFFFFNSFLFVSRIELLCETKIAEGHFSKQTHQNFILFIGHFI